MLKKSQRIAKKKDFDNIFKQGRIYSSDGLVLRFLANNLDFSRFAVVVSLKVSKKATERNLLKRRLMEILRLRQSRIKSGLDVVLVAKSKIKDCDYKDLEDSLIEIMKKARIYG